MTYHPHDHHEPPKTVRIKDKVVVRDDSRMAGTAMLAVLVAIIIGAVIFYAMSNNRPTTASGPSVERSAPGSTTGQGGTSSEVPAKPSPLPPR